MEIIHREDCEIKKLYEASVKGDVTLLDTLIQENPLILQKISLTPFTETPLHASTLGGHLEFTEALLLHHPQLSTQLDSKGRSPLHLASAEGHKEIVQALLLKYDAACVLYDQNGRIPLHYAAMRGRVEVLKELMNAKPDSIQRVVNGTGETVLHLCVKYSQLECLKLLMERVGENSDFLNARDCDGGKTFLQLALILKQIETVRYLLSLPVIKAERNDVITLLYVLDQHSLGDTKSLQLEHVFGGTSIRGPENNNDHNQQPLSVSLTTIVNNEIVEKGAKARWWTKLINCFKYPKNWLEETRGMLMVVATMISTVTFQSAINPPGGVWQNTDTHVTDASAGTAVLANLSRNYNHFRMFTNYNTITFLASLSVTLLLISGFPLHNRVCMWLLSMAMCLIIYSMAVTYLMGMSLVAPNSYDWFFPFIFVWITLLSTVGGIHTIRLLIWFVKRFRRGFNHKMPICHRNNNMGGSSIAV